MARPFISQYLQEHRHAHSPESLWQAVDYFHQTFAVSMDYSCLYFLLRDAYPESFPPDLTTANEQILILPFHLHPSLHESIGNQSFSTSHIRTVAPLPPGECFWSRFLVADVAHNDLRIFHPKLHNSRGPCVLVIEHVPLLAVFNAMTALTPRALFLYHYGFVTRHKLGLHFTDQSPGSVPDMLLIEVIIDLRTNPGKIITLKNWFE